MENNYHNLFSHLEAVEPPKGLMDHIMIRIEKEEHSLKIKVRFVLSFLSAMVTAYYVIPLFNGLHEAAVQSGFLGFVSLMFSDLGSVMQYWGEYSMSLVESVPYMELMSLLGVVFILLFALKYLVHDIKFVVPTWMHPTMKI